MKGIDMEPGVYLFKEEFCKILNIPQNQYNRRQSELVEWLYNFYDFEMLEGKPIRIHVKVEIGEYRPLPRKKYDTTSRNLLNREKLEKYGEFTVSSLGAEYQPNSKTRIARKAINAFGEEEYGHTNTEAVAKRFVAPTFDRVAESDGVRKWVWYQSYEVLDEVTVIEWREILKKWKVDTKNAAELFYAAAQGEDIDEGKAAYKNAMWEMKSKHGDFPVCVKSWKLKGGAE